MTFILLGSIQPQANPQVQAPGSAWSRATIGTGPIGPSGESNVMPSESVCPHCRSSAEAASGVCPSCGRAPWPVGPVLEPGEAGEFGESGNEPSDVGVRLDDGSTGCPLAFGPYRVRGLIGKGGMGLVFEAVHERTGDVVAVKTVRIRKRGMLHRIRREIQALARIEHPGLVRVIETGQSEGLPWYAMELVRGRSLHDLMLAGRKPAPAVVELGPRESSGWDTRPDFILASQPIDDSAFLLADGPTAAISFAPPSARSPTETVDSVGLDPATMLIQPPCPTALPDSVDDSRPARPPESSIETTSGWVTLPPIGRAPSVPIPEGSRRDFLVLIGRLCETLAYLHGEGVVHRDLKPHNVIIRPDGTPVLLDFGLASYFGAGGRESLEVGGKIEGTPEYMSPEQIRGEYVDARADLYALGCILYEGITGSVPFRGKTHGGTLRAHLKYDPLKPGTHVGDVPPELESLILRLLAKRAADRIGYASDVIHVLDQLGCVDSRRDETRPARDYLYRPGFVGREATLGLIERQIRRSLARPGRCIFLRGQSGVGKTRFIMEVARQLEQGGLTVITGECLPILPRRDRDDGPAFRATPLHPFRPFLQVVVDCCLERGCEEVARLLGPGGGVLSKCEPSLSDLPGAPDTPCPAVDEGGEGSLQSLLIEALGQTLTEFGRTAPVVLFLDDLEWADALTLHFLALFHVGIWDAPNVAIVGAYRSEAEREAMRDYPPVFRDATFVDIGPLDPDGLRAIIRDMLGSHEVDDRFVSHLARRSGGNPFFVAEFLRAAVAERVLLRDEEGCWRAGTGPDGAGLALDGETFDATVGMPGSLHDLVVRRLATLGGDARHLLELAAVVGREVDAELLESVEPIGEAKALAAVEALLVAQVLVEGRDGRFRFAHDKIREVAYEQIPPARKRSLHRSVALALEAVLDRPVERARHSNTLSHHWYRSIGDDLAEPDAVARATGHLETSLRAAVKAGLPAEAVEFGRALLRLRGVDLPESPAEVERALADDLARIEALLAGRSAADLLALPASTDPRVDETIELLLAIQPPAFLSDQMALFGLLASKGLCLTLESGLGPRASSVFAMTALVRTIALDETARALEFADLAIEVDGRAGGTRMAEVYFLRSWFVAHWVAPVREVLPDLDRGAEAGRVSGNVLDTCYNLSGYVALLAAAGEPLAQVIAEADARIAEVGPRVLVARFHAVLERQLARALAGLTMSPTSLTDESYDEGHDLSFICRTTNANQVGFYHVARLKLLYYRGEYREALRAADEALAVAGSFARQPAEVDLVFFRALALLASGDPGAPATAPGLLETLRRWQGSCPANFEHKALLVEAELARVEGREPDGSRYFEAARSAEAAGFPHHAALAYELAARHLARLGEHVRELRRRAIEGYRAWGADSLADRIEADSR